MNEKLQTLKLVLCKVKCKVEKIRENIITLKKLNFKLETLLSIIDVQSNKSIIPTHTDLVNNTCEENKEYNTLLKDSDFFNTTFTESLCIEGNKSLYKENYTFDEILSNSAEIKNHFTFISNAAKIINILNGEELTMDEIMRKSKVSKYRCIEIINELMKIKPPMVLKRYEIRHFKYKLNT